MPCPGPGAARRIGGVTSPTLTFWGAVGTVTGSRFLVETDGSRVLMSIDPKGDTKSTLTITHGRLAAGEAVEARRAFWRERLTELADRSAPRPPGGPTAG